MNLVNIFRTSINSLVSKQDVQEVIKMGGLVFPYPRRGEVRINGGKAKKATKEAIKLAQQHIKEQKQSKV